MIVTMLRVSTVSCVPGVRLIITLYPDNGRCDHLARGRGGGGITVMAPEYELILHIQCDEE